jgi:mRNA-degrading endonuclease RelE of RelBE toxin-antitoxin system
LARTVEWSKPAAGDLRALEAETQVRVVAGMNRFAATAVGDVKKLKGMSGMFRLRVGDQRVIFETTAEKILVSRVLNRRDAYR